MGTLPRRAGDSSTSDSSPSACTGSKPVTSFAILPRAKSCRSSGCSGKAWSATGRSNGTATNPGWFIPFSRRSGEGVDKRSKRLFVEGSDAHASGSVLPVLHAYRPRLTAHPAILDVLLGRASTGINRDFHRLVAV